MQERHASNGPPMPAQEIQRLRSAPKATLDARARSEIARYLTKRLAHDLAAWEQTAARRTNKRRGRLQKLETAIGAFTTDLLLAQNNPAAGGWVWRSLNKESFTGQTVSFRDFKALVEGWLACALIKRTPGFKEAVQFDPGDQIRVRGRASRFHATPKLLAVCAEYGVTPHNALEHFVYDPPEHPLQLRAHSRRVGFWKESGMPMSFRRTVQTAALEEPIKELNSYLNQHVISGATHRYFYRTFNMGDQKDFAWNKGGRLYSVGKDSYQMLPRTERLKIKIDGKAVCEIDIRASYLTILHSLYHEPFKVSTETDPYQIQGLPRNVVKAWCTIRFGSKSELIRLLTLLRNMQKTTMART
jgi:hypothetical protein